MHLLPTPRDLSERVVPARPGWTNHATTTDKGGSMIRKFPSGRWQVDIEPGGRGQRRIRKNARYPFHKDYTKQLGIILSNTATLALHLFLLFGELFSVPVFGFPKGNVRTF